MSKAIPILLFLGGCFLLWLLYLNRSSSKIQEAIVIIAIVIIGALFFVTKGESLQETIHSAYFINNKRQTPVFFSLAPGLGQHYQFQNVIFNNYQKRLSNQEKKISFNFPLNSKPIVDLQAIAILNHLFMFYSNYWYVERVSKEIPGGRMGTSRPREIGSVGNDLVKYDKNSLPNSLKQNMFFDDLIGPTTLALPGNTKVYYASREGDHPFCELRFYKRFSFDIRIKIHYSLYMLGMGSVGNYVLLTNEDKFIKANELKDYGTIVLITTCEAKFSRIMAWNPSVVRYKEWAKNLFDDLYNTFDWSICQREIMNYQQALLTQEIINKLR